MDNLQVRKIKRAYKIIGKRLPKTYLIPPIKIYKTIYYMLRAYAKESGSSYQQIKKWYNAYLNGTGKAQNNHYVYSKYRCNKTKNTHKEECFEIEAIGCNPIKLNLQNLEQASFQFLVFLLLHEIAHSYYKPKGQGFNEFLCDMFAIRWMKRFIKEKIIKKEN